MIPGADDFSLRAPMKQLCTCLCSRNRRQPQEAAHLDMQISTATRLLPSLVLMPLAAVKLAARVARQSWASAQTPWGMLSWLHSCAYVVSCLNPNAAHSSSGQALLPCWSFAWPTFAPDVMCTLAFVSCEQLGHVGAQNTDAFSWEILPTLQECNNQDLV